MGLRKLASAPEQRGFLGWPQGTVIPSNGDIPTNAEVQSDVGIDKSMRLSTVWACVRILADLVSTLPIKTYRLGADGSKTLLASPSVIASPSARHLPTQWRYQAMVSLLLRGNAYGLIVSRDRLGWPTQIEILHPDYVVVIVNPETGRVSYYVYGEQVPNENIWHLPAFMLPGWPIGLSPISYASQAINLGSGAEAFGAKFFTEGGIPPAILSADEELNETEAAQIKKAWMRARSGNREPAVMGSGIKFQAISVAPNESQFLETQAANRTTIANYFGVPPEMVGGASSGPSVTYANREQRAQDLLTFTVNGWLARWEESLTAMLPKPQFVQFDTRALLRSDYATRQTAHNLAAGKWETINEIRADEGLPPVDGGDQLVPVYDFVVKKPDPAALQPVEGVGDAQATN